jgi:hypothetical protein
MRRRPSISRGSRGSRPHGKGSGGVSQGEREGQPTQAVSRSPAPDRLQDSDHCQACWRFCRLAARGEEDGELSVVIDVPETVGHLYVHVPVWERGTGNPLGFFRDRIGSLGM